MFAKIKNLLWSEKTSKNCLRKLFSNQIGLKISSNKRLSNADKSIKGALSGLRKFLAGESLLKMMKNAFYFTSKALLVLKIYKFLSFVLTF